MAMDVGRSAADAASGCQPTASAADASSRSGIPNAAFTPGPWLIDADGNVCKGPYGEDRICEPLGDTHEEAEANGLLIAEAPRLYAELNEARLALRRISLEPRVPTAMREIASVRAQHAEQSLVKARGEQVSA